MTTKEFLIDQMKKQGIKLLFNRMDDYNGELKSPKIKGTAQQIEVAKFILSKYSISKKMWKGVKG